MLCVGFWMERRIVREIQFTAWMPWREQNMHAQIAQNDNPRTPPPHPLLKLYTASKTEYCQTNYPTYWLNKHENTHTRDIMQMITHILCDCVVHSIVRFAYANAMASVWPYNYHPGFSCVWGAHRSHARQWESRTLTLYAVNAHTSHWPQRTTHSSLRTRRQTVSVDHLLGIIRPTTRLAVRAVHDRKPSRFTFFPWYHHTLAAGCNEYKYYYYYIECHITFNYLGGRSWTDRKPVEHNAYVNVSEFKLTGSCVFSCPHNA